nr:replication initiation and membrane attachment family protein [Halalkalibacter oceani]
MKRRGPLVTWHWKELLPVDRFTVRTSYYLAEQDRLTLTLLYQPLIGASAHSLYLTLLSQLERDQYWSGELTHRQLMLLLGESLEVIYEERKKLEAIGLLKTFKRKDEEGSTYLYELQPPMTPRQFFENDVLSVYLFNRLGKTYYRQLRERFMLDEVAREEYTELTYAFDEVYASLHHSEMVSNLKSETGKVLHVDERKALISRQDEQDVTFASNQFDFELFEKSLSKSIVPDSALTEEIKSAIIRLAFVYKIEPLEMSSIVQQTFIHEEEVSSEQLRKKVQEWYKIEQGTEPPALGLRTHPLKERSITAREPATEEERIIHFYETTPPLTLLEIRSDGAKVAAADVKIIESLMLDHKLLPGVINVLLDFILWSQDMKLSKALVDKIASHWARKKVRTVKEAMQLALLEQNKSNQNSRRSGSYPKASTKGKANPRRDKLPKWLLAEKQKEQDTKAAASPPSGRNELPVSGDKSFEEMLEELKKSKAGKGES